MNCIMGIEVRHNSIPLEPDKVSDTSAEVMYSPENPMQTHKNWRHSYILSGSKAFMSTAWAQLCLFQYMAKRQNATWDFYTFQGPSAMKTHLSLWLQVCYWSKMVRKKRRKKEREKRERRNSTRKKTTKGKNAGEKEP